MSWFRSKLKRVRSFTRTVTFALTLTVAALVGGGPAFAQTFSYTAPAALEVDNVADSFLAAIVPYTGTAMLALTLFSIALAFMVGLRRRGTSGAKGKA